MSSRGERRLAAALFVSVNVTATLLAANTLTGAVWAAPRFTFKRTEQTSADLLQAVRPDARRVAEPDEYEACERVRFHRFVRAPCNAFSSLAYLSAPAFQLATNQDLWAGQTRGLRGLAAGFGLVSIGLGTALAHASFLYHASATVEMNRLDVRCMMLFLVHNTLKCIYMSARHALHSTWGGTTWRRQLEDKGLPLFGEITVLFILLAVATNLLNDYYDVLLAVTVTTMMVHLVLFVAGVLLKVLDDSKILCVGDWARDSAVQLTGALHVLTGVSSLMSDMHTSSLLESDAAADKDPALRD